MSKFKRGKGVVPKKRDICYAAHIDRCIYQYYSHILNEKYNERTTCDGISNVAVAYRTNLGKSNIQFSKAAYDFIRKTENCYVMIGDFTHFFDDAVVFEHDPKACEMRLDTIEDAYIEGTKRNFVEKGVYGDSYREDEKPMAWGELTYAKPLTEKQMEDYELKPAPGNPDRVRPSITARLKEGTRGQDPPKEPGQKRSHQNHEER